MINKLFGKHASIASTAILFAVGGSLYVGWIDPVIAGVITGFFGLHAGVSASAVGVKK